MESVDEFGERFPRVGAGGSSGTDCLPARTANSGLMDLNSVGIRQPERRQARHSCSIQNQTRFQAPSGAEYAAPTGLGNWVARVATKISLLTELRSAGLRHDNGMDEATRLDKNVRVGFLEKATEMTDE